MDYIHYLMQFVYVSYVTQLYVYMQVKTHCPGSAESLL